MEKAMIRMDNSPVEGRVLWQQAGPKQGKFAMILLR